jgi:hypothetical protein
METADELRARAERTIKQRSLEKLSASVTDPKLRTMAREFASGRLPADQFVRQMERSAPAMRGLDRCIKHYATLTPEELAAAKAQRDRDIDAMVAELTEADRVPQQPARAPRVVKRVEEESWENQSWLE